MVIRRSSEETSGIGSVAYGVFSAGMLRGCEGAESGTGDEGKGGQGEGGTRSV